MTTYPCILTHYFELVDRKVCFVSPVMELPGPSIAKDAFIQFTPHGQGPYHASEFLVRRVIWNNLLNAYELMAKSRATFVDQADLLAEFEHAQRVYSTLGWKGVEGWE